MNIMESVLVREVLKSVWGYIVADWYILLAGILIASFVTVYVDANQLKDYFKKKSGYSLPGAVTFGALTPLCACGTTAVMLSMFVSALPWGPVMAFMISSPLTSPSEYLFETAFLGSQFANAMVVSSIALGLLAGVVAHSIEKYTAFFEGQFRLNGKTEKKESSTPKSTPASQLQPLAMSVPKVSFIKKHKLNKFFFELYNTGVKKILFYFVIFIAAGKVIEFFIPSEWIMMGFSPDKAYSIPLAALIGLPLYLTDASALPLMKSFLNSGAGEGAILAFLIAGKATGVPVMAGMATLMKKRALLFYVGFIFIGAIVSGTLYQWIL